MMDVKIVERDSFWVVGMTYSGPMKAVAEIPRLWEAFHKKTGEINHRANEDVAYGVFYVTPEQQKKGEMTYLAGVPVTMPGGIPAGMAAKKVEGGRYAMITHHGPVMNIATSIDFLFRTWMAGSGYSVDERAGFEQYDSRFRGNAEDSAFDIYAPVKEKG